MTHAIGNGIIDLIQKHEPDAVRIVGADQAAAQAARERVLRDLGDSIGGLLAFTIAAAGADAARSAALLVMERISVAAPGIVRQAQAELRRKTP
jgi:hypothetical protein